MRVLLPRIENVLRNLHRPEAIYRPVKIDEILAAVRATGAIDAIELIPSDIDPDILQAKIIVKRIANKRIASIYFSKRAPKPDQRFAIAKETVHIFDAPDEKTTIDQDLERLLDDLCVDGASGLETAQIAAEHRARLGAIELLVPFEARMVLKGSWMVIKNDTKTIADGYGVPERVMRRALNDSYNEQIRTAREQCGVKYIGAD